MGHHTAIIIFGVLSFMGWYGCVFTTKRLMKQGGLPIKYWPKRYIMPNRKIRRLYGLKKKEIPKWCYFQFIISFVYIALLIIILLLYLLMSNKLLVLQCFMWFWCTITVLNGLYTIVCSVIYKM